MLVLIIEKVTDLIWPGSYLSMVRRLWGGLCPRCGGKAGDEREHTRGCPDEHFSEEPAFRVLVAVLMVPIGAVVLARLVLCAALLAVFLPVRFALGLLGVDPR